MSAKDITICESWPIRNQPHHDAKNVASSFLHVDGTLAQPTLPWKALKGPKTSLGDARDLRLDARSDFGPPISQHKALSTSATVVMTA